MKKLWNDWSGPVAFTLGGTLLLAAALLMPNVPVSADPGLGAGTAQGCDGDVCAQGCAECFPAGPGGGTFCQHGEEGKTCGCAANPPGKKCNKCTCKLVPVDSNDPDGAKHCKCRE